MKEKKAKSTYLDGVKEMKTKDVLEKIGIIKNRREDTGKEIGLGRSMQTANKAASKVRM